MDLCFLKWTREGFISLQPEMLSEYMATLGLFSSSIFAISLFIVLLVAVALNRVSSKQIVAI